MYRRLLRRVVAHLEAERPSLQEFRLGNAETVDRLTVQGDGADVAVLFRGAGRFDDQTFASAVLPVQSDGHFRIARRGQLVGGLDRTATVELEKPQCAHDKPAAHLPQIFIAGIGVVGGRPVVLLLDGAYPLLRQVRRASPVEQVGDLHRGFVAVIDGEGGEVVACRIKVGTGGLLHRSVQAIDKTFAPHRLNQLFGGMRDKPSVVKSISLREAGRMIRVEGFYPLPLFVFRANKARLCVEKITPVTRTLVEELVVFLLA